MAGVTDIYRQGNGEASLLPQKDYSPIFQQMYLQQERKNQRERGELEDTYGKLSTINNQAWEIDQPDFTKRKNDTRQRLAEMLATGKANIADIPMLVEKEYAPILAEESASKQQRTDLMKSLADVYGDKEGKFDTETFDRGVEIYKDPKRAAITNPEIAKQLEQAGGNVVMWRGLYGSNYLNAPIRYDDVAFRDDLYKNIETSPLMKYWSGVDPVTGQKVDTYLEGSKVNYGGILKATEGVLAAAAAGDTKARNFLERRFGEVNRDFDIIDEGGVPKITPKGTNGTEILKIAKEYFPEELKSPDQAMNALIKAEAMKIGEGYQKTNINRTDQYRGRNPDFFDNLDVSVGNGYEDYLRDNGAEEGRDIIVDAFGRESGTMREGIKSLSKVPQVINLSPEVFNSKTGTVYRSGGSANFLPGEVSLEYVYKPNTIIDGKDVSGTIVPTYNRENHKEMSIAKPMVLGEISEQVKANPYSDPETVKSTVYVPLDNFENGYLLGLDKGEKVKEQKYFYSLKKKAEKINKQPAKKVEVKTITKDEYRKLSLKDRQAFINSGGTVK